MKSFIMLAFIITSTLHAQEKPMRFPELTAEKLSGEKITFLDDLNHETNILILVFERNSQKLVDTWAEIILKEYEPQSNIQYYEVPMISYWYKPIGWQIDNWMRDGIPEDYHDNTITFYGNRQSYFEQLDMPDKSSCYLFILDQEGYIRFRTEGARDSLKEEAFRAAMNE